jgi:hypothetical protein
MQKNMWFPGRTMRWGGGRVAWTATEKSRRESLQYCMCRVDLGKYRIFRILFCHSEKNPCKGEQKKGNVGEKGRKTKIKGTCEENR